jgi:hypothetical protein
VTSPITHHIIWSPAKGVEAASNREQNDPSTPAFTLMLVEGPIGVKLASGRGIFRRVMTGIGLVTRVVETV